MPVRKNLYIFGGLVKGRGGSPEYEVSKEMWRFAIDARKWTGPIVSISDTVTGPPSAVGNVSGYRCEADCRSRGCKLDPSMVPYFRGD